MKIEINKQWKEEIAKDREKKEGREFEWDKKEEREKIERTIESMGYFI